MRTALAVTVLLVSLGAKNLAAQSFVPFEATRNDLRDIRPSDSDRGKLIAQAVSSNIADLALYSLGQSVYTSLVEADRIDKQVGASGSAQGSTSLVSRGSVPSLLGFAVENGALYQSVSDSLVTFRLNPSGIARAITKNSYLIATPPQNTVALEKVLNNLSGSVSFDFKQGSTPGTFNGTRSQLKEATVRFDIVNKRDPRHPSHAPAMRQLIREMDPLIKAVQNYFTAVKEMDNFSSWIMEEAETLTKVNLQDDEELRAALVELGDSFTKKYGSKPELKRLATTMVDAVKSYRPQRNALFESIPKSAALTVEYAFNKLAVPEAGLTSLPVGTPVPDLSSLRLIYSAPLGTRGEATLNASATMFNQSVGEIHGSLRDVQVSGSVEFRISEITGIGRPVVTFAALGAFLRQQPFGSKVTLNGIETANGTIFSFQSKVTVPAGRSGVQIPLSLTISNRSEFLTEEKDIRGAFGLTFDMDKLFAR